MGKKQHLVLILDSELGITEPIDFLNFDDILTTVDANIVIDKNGNYSLGLEEQLMFPEIEYDKIDQVRGMDISIVTTANKQEEGLVLLKEFGLPFKN
mgnify:CR=1 FL=1